MLKSSQKLIIFDCDGVLVDSETIGLRVLASMLQEQGFEITSESFIKQYRGCKIATCLEEMQNIYNIRLPVNFESNYRTQAAKAFRKQLQPVQGIHEALNNIEHQTCVASSAPIEKIRLVLGLTNLLHYFEGRIFSAYEVGIWKPDPGLFLFACKEMERDPDGTIVIEDSIVGIQAAIAANMKVLGYGTIDQKEELQSAGAVFFDNMQDLPELIKKTFNNDSMGMGR